MIDIESEYLQVKDTPSDINEHVPTLRRFASECSHVTEFGVRSGNSTRAIMAARPARLVSYDISENEFMTRLFSQEQGNGYEYSYVLQDVLEAEIEPTQMLFIDTWHSYDQLSEELKLHAGKVSRYIILHDTVTYGLKGENCYGKEATAGLWAALGEFFINNPTWRVLEHFPNNNGLTVLVRSNVTAEIEMVAYQEPQKKPTWRQERGL